MKLREIRAAKGLTQQQLADQAGVAREVISRVENEKVDPEVRTLKKLAKVLECGVDDLISDREITEAV